jgi:hypothetical protein
VSYIEAFDRSYDVVWRDGDGTRHRLTFETRAEASVFRVALDGGVDAEDALGLVAAARETARPAQEPPADATQMRFSG